MWSTRPVGLRSAGLRFACLGSTSVRSARARALYMKLYSVLYKTWLSLISCLPLLLVKFPRLLFACHGELSLFALCGANF
jgi:hypothetical protein